jgi:hypothetical protein
MIIEGLRSLTIAGFLFSASAAMAADAAPVRSGPCRINDIEVDGAPAPLGVETPQGAEGEHATFLFSGTPDLVSVSEATRINEVWAVSGKRVGRAALLAPPGFRGRFLIRLQCLIAGKEFEDRAQVQIGPPRSQREFDDSPLMKQAKALLDDGDFARARLLLEPLANLGCGRAAFLLHRTYDADFLTKRAAQGTVPNAALAQKWLTTARDLGYDGQNRELASEAPR